ncbi:thiolase domain-containing protein [Bacillus sp. AGMB 02131]|uniref:Thiolase domain-containing protein n=1 Tax=Peribacillus faecalis TaxID=2772559 RepID=A0A927CX15_9BACI|nr:acetyl-CoA acetyltransferase [Peribacillus faecalis]MBD3107205.1 thiolase domain-containing protein [Peribacillus faecalis]
MMSKVYVLGGYQTDFSQKWSGEDALFRLMKETTIQALTSVQILPSEVEAAHIGNFAGELFTGQGQLGGLFASIHPDLSTIPTSRHEAACASGSIALLSGAADIEAGRYDLVCVLGVEQMKNVSTRKAAEYLGAASWVGREAQEAEFPWPYLFSQLVDFYDERYGIQYEHLGKIAEINLTNAKRNPLAQTRNWQQDANNFTNDDACNPVVEGLIRKNDCGRTTDGGAAIFLASERFAAQYAKRNGMTIEQIPFIKGWGHRTAPMLLADKLKRSSESAYVFPHVRQAIQDAFKRAHIAAVEQIDGIELHDCFTITEYMVIDHFGLTEPGASWRAIEDGTIEFGGKLPINPSGGLIGSGHPVGATGVRMLLDAFKQVTGKAENYQVEGAKTFATLNIGGSTTTVVCFVIGL